MSAGGMNKSVANGAKQKMPQAEGLKAVQDVETQELSTAPHRSARPFRAPGETSD